MLSLLYNTISFVWHSRLAHLNLNTSVSLEEENVRIRSDAAAKMEWSFTSQDLTTLILGTLRFFSCIALSALSIIATIQRCDLSPDTRDDQNSLNLQRYAAPNLLGCEFSRLAFRVELSQAIMFVS